MPPKKRETRIKAEEKRLRAIYGGMDGKRYAVVDGLIQRASNHRVQLEDFEKDLAEHGYVEMFRQGENQKPYERKRPTADLYNTLNGLYQKEIKQLSDLLPKEEVKEKDDGYEDFVNGREDI